MPSLLWEPRLKFTSELEQIDAGGYPAMRYRHVLDAEMAAPSSVFDVYNDPLCPRRGGPDPLDNQAYIDTVRIIPTVPDDLSKFFLIHIGTRTDFTESTNPLQDPAEVEWYSQSYQNFDTRDREGKHVFNTAGSLFKFAFDDAYWIARVTKNLSNVPLEIFRFENAVNRSAISIDGVNVVEESVRCNGLRISPWRQAVVNGNRVWYKSLTFMLIHRREGWKIKKDNVGFEQLVIRERPAYDDVVREAGGRRQLVRVPRLNANNLPEMEMRAEREPILLPNGQRPYTEQVLDKDGLWVSDPRPEDVITIEIDKYHLEDLSSLPGVGDPPRARGSLGAA